MDKPLIHYAIEEVIEAEINEIIFITGKGKAILQSHFNRSHELKKTLKANNKQYILSGIVNTLSPHIKITYIC